MKLALILPSLVLPFLVACAAPQITEKRVYDREGRLHWVYESKSGIPDGVSRTYYPEGQVRMEGHFKNAQRHGLFVEYHENGSIAEKAFYWDDALVWRSRLPSDELPAPVLVWQAALHEKDEIRRPFGDPARWEATRTWFYDARPPAPTFVHADWRIPRRPLVGARIQVGGASAPGTTAISESVFAQIPWGDYAASALLTQSQILGNGRTLQGRRVLDLGGNRHWDTSLGQFVSRTSVSVPVAGEDAETVLVSAAAVPQSPAMAAAAVGSTFAVRVGGSWLRQNERMGVQLDLGADRVIGGAQPSTPTFVRAAIAAGLGIRSVYGTLELSTVGRLDVSDSRVSSAGVGAAFRVRGFQVKTLAAASDDLDLTGTLGVEHEF